MPTHDGGVEHTAATFDDASAWLAGARMGRIILFPPQFYLLSLVSDFLTGPPPPSLPPDSPTDDPATAVTARYEAQRAALLSFINRTPTSRSGDAPGSGPHPTANIPWSEKVICPTSLFTRRGDGRVVLGLDKPGPELRGSEIGGDGDRVVLVRFRKGGPADLDVRWRVDVLREEKRAEMVKRETTETRERDSKGPKL
jgi:hypothetical protein